MGTATIVLPVPPDAAQAYEVSTPQDQWNIQQMVTNHLLHSQATRTESKEPLNSELYTQDFFEWTQTTATLIREGKWYDLDREALAEEVESLGRSEKRELEHRLDGLLMHLLKWRYQPSGRQTGHSWRSTIRDHRRQLARLLRDNPSLQPRVATMLPESYANARLDASDETGLPLTTFPQACPWTLDQILDNDFWPDESGMQDAR